MRRNREYGAASVRVCRAGAVFCGGVWNGEYGVKLSAGDGDAH